MTMQPPFVGKNTHDRGSRARTTTEYRYLAHDMRAYHVWALSLVTGMDETASTTGVTHPRIGRMASVATTGSAHPRDRVHCGRRPDVLGGSPRPRRGQARARHPEAGVVR